MKASPLAIADVLVVEPRLFSDDRGFFFEVFNAAAFERECGVRAHFVQQNFSRSKRNVVRGLHYQIRQTQGKLVRAAAGEIFDVVVDLRRSSKTFGKWASHILTADSRQAIWVPPGFAHGFLALSESADVIYDVTDYWAPAHERQLLWNDREVGIAWPLTGEPLLSNVDRAAKPLKDAELFD